MVTVPICGTDRKYINAGDELDVADIRFTLNEWMDLLGPAICCSDLCADLKVEKSSEKYLCTIVEPWDDRAIHRKHVRHADYGES